jgi:hypothetical protein
VNNGASTGAIGRRGWLPPGKSAAVVFSVDDIHPGSSADPYEAGGDLQDGALGRLAEFMGHHPDLKASLCVTPDWRLNSLVPDTRVMRHVPGLRNHVHWTRLHPKGHFRLDKFPSLVRYLNGLERCEVVLHGLHHAHRGPRLAVEFQDQSEAECARIVRRGMEIFDTAGIRCSRGFAPPAWNAPPPLIAALGRLGFDYLLSARDVNTAISEDALTAMSGLSGVSLIYPQRIGAHGIVHLSTNFQATSPLDRAFQIIELGGLLHIKAHIFKSGGGHIMQDGIDALYLNYLDAVLRILQQRFGGALWWAHLSEVAARARLHA